MIATRTPIKPNKIKIRMISQHNLSEDLNLLVKSLILCVCVVNFLCDLSVFFVVFFIFF